MQYRRARLQTLEPVAFQCGQSGVNAVAKNRPSMTNFALPTIIHFTIYPGSKACDQRLQDPKSMRITVPFFPPWHPIAGQHVSQNRSRHAVYYSLLGQWLLDWKCQRHISKSSVYSCHTGRRLIGPILRRLCPYAASIPAARTSKCERDLGESTRRCHLGHHSCMC
jgi:hypothetical protein